MRCGGLQLERGAQVEQTAQGLGVEAGDAGAAVALERDEALAGERPQRHAQGVACDVVLLGQLALDEPGAGPQLALEDALAQRGGEGVDGGDGVQWAGAHAGAAIIAAGSDSKCRAAIAAAPSHATPPSRRTLRQPGRSAPRDAADCGAEPHRAVQAGDRGGPQVRRGAARDLHAHDGQIAPVERQQQEQAGDRDAGGRERRGEQRGAARREHRDHGHARSAAVGRARGERDEREPGGAGEQGQRARRARLRPAPSWPSRSSTRVSSVQ